MAEQAGMVVEDTAVKKLGLYLASMNEQERRDFGNAPWCPQCIREDDRESGEPDRAS